MEDDDKKIIFAPRSIDEYWRWKPFFEKRPKSRFQRIIDIVVTFVIVAFLLYFIINTLH
jgi:hypothetical protein